MPLPGPSLLQALVLGAGTLAASCRAGLLLLAFFFASSKITQVCQQLFGALLYALHQQQGHTRMPGAVVCLGRMQSRHSSARPCTPQ